VPSWPTLATMKFTARLFSGSDCYFAVRCCFHYRQRHSYPISGVWAEIDLRFPKARSEMCIAVKTFGSAAVANNSIAEIIIFDQKKRFYVRGDATGETIIKSIKAVDGRFRITETFSKGTNWLGFKRKVSYFLTIVDPQTIEIRDARTFSRYTKCGPRRRNV
jgi:hypothetical protein